MTDETSDDRRTSELLRKLEQDSSQVSARRSDIRAQVLGHYDQLRELQTDQHDDDAIVVELTPTAGSDDEPQRPWPARLAVAAAVTAVFVGAWFLVQNNDDTVDTASPFDVPSTIDNSTSTPTTTPPIDESNDVSLASGEISFALPGGLDVVERDEGILVFGRSPEATAFGQRIIAVEVDSTDFRSQLSELSRSREVSIGATGVLRIDGEEFTNWSVIIREADLDSSCEAVQGCLELIDGLPISAVPLGVTASVDELVSSSGATVLILSDPNGSAAPDVAALLDATTIS